ncbi:Cytochrome b-c1 complex subunit 6, mitochondrial [Halotydeus destructor]|nr:Cytochrome b-c1 complex subunit 6, mitochondrial [Halotydeus destructor]
MATFFSSLSAMFHNVVKATPVAVVKAEEEEDELVDPQETLRAECTSHHCENYKTKLETCNERVNSRSQTAETCFEEILDFMHCVDHCASQKLFSKLK